LLKDFERVKDVILGYSIYKRCKPITAVGISLLKPHSRLQTRHSNQRAKIRVGKMPFISKL